MAVGGLLAVEMDVFRSQPCTVSGKRGRLAQVLNSVAQLRGEIGPTQREPFAKAVA